MNCQRCLRGEAVYRAHTDAMDIKICPVCAEEAQRLKIAIEVLENSERVGDGAPRSSQLLNSFIE